MAKVLYRVAYAGIAASLVLSIAITRQVRPVRSFSLAEISASEQAEYGAYFNDFKFCSGIQRSYSSIRTCRLSPDQIERLERLQTAPNLISQTATATLAIFANQYPGLKAALVRRIPAMVESGDPRVQYSAVQVAYWYRASGQRRTILRLRSGLSPTTFDERELAKMIDLYLARVGRA